MLDQRLLALIGSFSDPGHRTKAAKKLAEALGAEDLIILSKDPVLEVLLPSPGFPQTLPNGIEWKRFISECLGQQHYSSELVSPYTKNRIIAHGLEAADGSLLVLLGLKPNIIMAIEVVALVPLIVSALSNESIAAIAKGEIETESLYSERAKVLANALDSTRRSLETELRKSTSILNSITDAFFALDTEWKFVEMNSQAEDLLQQKRESVLGKKIWDLYPEAQSSNFHQQYEQAMISQKAVFFEEYFESIDAWYEVRAYPARDGLAVYFNNIDERKKAAEELLQSQQWFQTTLRSIGDGVIAINVDRTVSFLNAVAEELTGWKLSEALGKPMDEVFNIIHEKTRKPAKNPVDRVLKEGKVVGMANHTALISRDGTEYVIEDSAAPIRNSEGEITGVVLVFRDVTEDYSQKNKLEETYIELKKAIIERDRSLETLGTINKVGQRLTAELDLDKLVQQVTDDATRLTEAQFGAFFYNTVDESGNSLLLNVVSGVPKEEFAKFPNPRATAIFQPTFIGAGTVRSGDITKDPRYGKNAPYNGLPPGHLPVRSYLAVSVISRTGEVIGGLFFGHAKENVFTEQAERIAEGLAAQAAVAMDNARLYGKVQESVRARDEFLSIASHELKTPLTSLKLQTQIRNKRIAKGDISYFNAEVLQKMFDTDSRQIDRLTRLIDDMLDISRISTGKLSLQPETFELCSLVKDILERHATQIYDYGSPVKFHCTSIVEGTWDKFRIEQVVTNLLTNALRYGNQKPVDIYVMARKGMAVIIVEDKGLGIAKENQARIFERFERAVSASDVSGLGLGLYIIKQILDMHNGSIEVESEQGQGSKFIINLPLNDGSVHG